MVFCIEPKHGVQMFSRLQAQHEEVTTLCGNLKFPGPGQRPTPVADARIGGSSTSAYFTIPLPPEKKVHVEVQGAYAFFLRTFVFVVQFSPVLTSNVTWDRFGCCRRGCIAGPARHRVQTGIPVQESSALMGATRCNETCARTRRI